MKKADIKFEKVIKLIKQDNVFLINVLPQEYYQEENIKGSKNACVYEVSFLGQIKNLGIKKSDLVIVYDLGTPAMASKEARKKLIEAGYKNSYYYMGGIGEWKKKRMSTQKGKKVVLPKAPDKTYRINKSQSRLEWTGRNPINKHWGTLGILDAEIKVRQGRVVSGHILIDMKKINNDDIPKGLIRNMLIRHLQSDDFFDVIKYPLAKFKIKNHPIVKNKKSFIQGEMTIKDKTNQEAFPAYISFDGKYLISTFQLSFDRTKYNVLYGSNKVFAKLGKHLVNDHIYLDAKLVFY